MAENLGEIIIYQTDDGLANINVKIQDETVWLTQQQLVELYQSSKANVSEHIKHIFEEGELERNQLFGNSEPLQHTYIFYTLIKGMRSANIAVIGAAAVQIVVNPVKPGIFKHARLFFL